MIVIDVKDGEPIGNALKRYKRKHRDIGVVKQLRSRKHFVKKSIQRREEILSASYKLQKFRED